MGNERCPSCGGIADHGPGCPRVGETWVVERQRGGLEAGTKVAGQYVILEPIGEGAVGLVYRARQESIGRDVAIKVLRECHKEHEIIIRRFENEAKAVSQLRHPNTVRLIDFHKAEDGDLFIITELLRGASLRSVIDQGPIPIDRALRIAEEIAASIGEAHGLGIVHRDLKPENIFIDRVGADDVVKVLDFGIAKLHGPNGSPTLQNMVIGTPTYMPPEQARAETADGRADLYALGVILYEMLRGRPPFSGDTAVSVLVQHITDVPPPLSSPDSTKPFAPELEALVSSLLAKDRDARPKDAETVRERLRLIRETSRGRSGRSPRPRRRSPLVLAAATALGGIGVLVVLTLASRPSAVRFVPGPSSEATPSEATPSEATPSEATPSEATPSEATPSTEATLLLRRASAATGTVAEPSSAPASASAHPRARVPAGVKAPRRKVIQPSRPPPRLQDGPLPVEID